MKIVIDNGGQTCNKFWSYLAPLDYAITNNIYIYIYYPDKELSSYHALTHNKYFRFPLYFPYFNKVMKPTKIEKYIRYLNKLIPIPKIINKIHPDIIWDSFNSHKNIDLEKLRPYVQEIFRPNKDIVDIVSDTFNIKRKEFDIIVGVHIRRGDYANWLNGKFYYSDEKYLSVIEKICTKFPYKKIGFYFASNEAIDKTNFRSIDYFQIDKATPAIDLYALSRCDYIIGPPSTFSNWAAFYGNHPIQFIENPSSFSTDFLNKTEYSYPVWEKDKGLNKDIQQFNT
ncbi:MAG: alpha-1,2-fucosyltransferase [Muribaculum sp.]|nr:alpha-1,2-fucosyltransferase [Muribaculum sp.]